MRLRHQMIANFSLTMLGLIGLLFTLGFTQIIQNTPLFYAGFWAILIVPLLNTVILSAAILTTKTVKVSHYLIPVLFIFPLSIVFLILPGSFQYGSLIYWLGLNLVVAGSNFLGYWFFQRDD